MKTILLSFLSIVIAHSVISQNLPYTTGFDNATEQSGWTYYQVGDAGSSEWGMTGGGFSAPNALHHDYNVGGAQDDIVIDWMVSPPLNFTGPVAISLMASESGFSTPTTDNCEVYIGTGSQNPESGTYVLVGNLSFISPQFTWIDTTFYSEITGANCYLAFRYKTVGAAWCTYSIDDVSITLQDPNSVSNMNADENAFYGYPNPAHESVQISLPENSGPYQLSIISSTGQTIREDVLTGLQQECLEITGIPTGLYYLRLRNSAGREWTDRLFIKS
ncbi:MAG: T9SS type A sorting domain-containing protein [Flavobacteriales bacterium]|nr:T9SS type A sorting domain-containing protein [Flavobacteriales bacterium]